MRSADVNLDMTAEPAIAPRGATTMSARFAAYLELTKPGIVRMVLITAATGFFLAAGPGLDVLLLVNTLFGIALAASGSCGLNEFVERSADARMNRTATRPIPDGRLTAREAHLFSWALSIAGLVWLQLFVGTPTSCIVGITLVSYVYVYTPLKKRTWMSTIVGAIPGALPILAGWAAGGGGLTAPGFALFAILFLWQMPHFYALAWLYRVDYARGGFRMLTTVDPSGLRAGRQIVFFGALLIPVSLLPTLLGLTGSVYLTAAAVLGTAFLGLGVAMAARRDDRRAMRLFLGSVAYLPLLLLMMVVDRLIG
jgi:heme o synthase